MASRMMLANAGVLIVGLILLAIGAVIEPARPNISQSGESLIAIGLTFIMIAIGFFLSGAAPT